MALQFGLEQQGHIGAIEGILKDFGPCDYAWKKIGKAIGWEHGAARDGYTRYLIRKNKESLLLLRQLADLQNGAPLEKYKEEWKETMKNIYEFLEKNETKS